MAYRADRKVLLILAEIGGWGMCAGFSALAMFLAGSALKTGHPLNELGSVAMFAFGALVGGLSAIRSRQRRSLADQFARSVDQPTLSSSTEASPPRLD